MLARMNQVLGIECGGTRTVALLADERGEMVERKTAGPANLKLLDDAALVAHFRGLAASLPQPGAIAIGMAGARTAKDFQRIQRAASEVWPGIPARFTNDLETALAAAPETSRKPDVRVLVLSGTGSCCFGVSKQRTVKVGGWGHILGDKGSGYEIGLRGLKAVVYHYDRDGVWPGLGQRLLRKLCLNEPNELIEWVQRATKADVAALAVEVFEAWHAGDGIATDIVDAAASSLGRDAIACAKRLGKGTAQFVFAGSILLQQPRFARKVSSLIRRQRKKALTTPLRRESAWGAVELARRLAPAPPSAPVIRKARSEAVYPADLKQLASLPTEQRNPRSMKLSELPIRAAIKLMLSEDAQVPNAILTQSRKIARVVEWIVQAIRKEGRLIYVGAGTSGRLGVLDASECPPTFRADPKTVQGIIAGGQRALWEAVEGAEDDPQAGARAAEFHGVGRNDLVVGIAASGRTPFVWGALRHAKRKGARTVLLCFNPGLTLPWQPDIVISPNVGPEVLTGSTRLKSGTATKLILNIFTTLAMVRMGKVLSNLMIDVKASNVKLRDRAVRIVQQLTNCDYASCLAALEKKNWDIKSAAKLLGRR